MKQRDYLIFGIFAVLIIFLVTGFNGCDPGAIQNDELEWREIETEAGRWSLTNKSCIEEETLDYMCYSNCYEKSYTEIWEVCLNLGKIKRTDTGVEVLCFSHGCIPEIVEGECRITCPTGAH